MALWWKNNGVVYDNGIKWCDRCPCESPPPVECPTDCSGCSRTITITFSGGTGGCVRCNRTATLIYYGSCTWAVSGADIGNPDYCMWNSGVLCQDMKWRLTASASTGVGSRSFLLVLDNTDGCPPRGTYVLPVDIGAEYCPGLTATMVIS